MFCDIFSKLIKERNLNPLRIAKDISVPKSIVYEWKDGKREPTVENMVKLSEYFNVSLDFLTGQVDFDDTEEKELIVMLRAAKEISEQDHNMLIKNFKDNLSSYLHSKK